MSPHHIVDETLAGRGRLQTQESGQSAVLLHNNPIHVQQPSDISALGGDRDGQSGQEDSGGHPAAQTEGSITVLSVLRVKPVYL